MLSSTFQRVYDSSKAYFLLQRAIEIVRIENSDFYKCKRLKHLKSLQTKFVDKNFTLFDEMFDSNNFDDANNSLIKEISEINKRIDGVEEKIVI
jgi:hypothetical protein